ncbi:MAG: ABC-type branched-subunit amino acid transport system substrate-binding protein [Polyangiales bacterium]|jgi:ABC-type branched-subunit amino acid transport system substrate-binding protein
MSSRALRPKSRLLLLCLGVFVSACAAPGPEVGADPIRIGVVVSLSGGAGEFGPSLLQAAQLVEREVAAAGGLLGGRPVEIVFADDRTEVDQAVRVARQLIEEEGVVAIIGPLISGATLAVAEVTQAAQIPQISCCATSEDLTAAQPTDNRFLFRTVPSDLLQAQVSARYAADNCQRLSILHLDDAYGNPFAASLVSVFESLATGEQSVSTPIPFAPGRANYAAEVTQLAGENPDCIALIAFAEEGGFILRDWSQLADAPDVTWIGSDGLKNDDFPANAGSAANVDGVVGTAPISEPDSNAFNTFADNFRATYTDNPGAFGTQQYDAMMVLVLAIEHAGSTDGAAIRDSLFQVSSDPGEVFEPGELAGALEIIREGGAINYEGASGPVDFDAQGNIVADYEIWRFDAAMDGYVTQQVVRASELQ